MFGFGRLTHKTDEQLLHDFSRGKTKAFEILVERYRSALEHYAQRTLQNPQIAEEITADVFERLARERGQWQLHTSFRAYLFAMVRNRCFDEMRRRRREHEAHPHIVALEAHRQQPPHPEAVARLGELAQSLELAISKLPEAHRDVVLLRLVHGLSGEETAQIVQCSEEQVRSLLSYARKQIRKTLTEQPEPRGQTLRSAGPEPSDWLEPHTTGSAAADETRSSIRR